MGSVKGQKESTKKKKKKKKKKKHSTLLQYNPSSLFVNNYRKYIFPHLQLNAYI